MEGEPYSVKLHPVWVTVSSLLSLQNWCMKRRSQSIYLQLLTDKHAPEHYRYTATQQDRTSFGLFLQPPHRFPSVVVFQGDRQRVTVWRVLPCFPLFQRFPHEPRGQMLRLVTPLSLSFRPDDLQPWSSHRNTSWCTFTRAHRTAQRV